MIQKAYNINGEIKFTNNDYPGFEHIEEREFTQDEMDHPKIENGKIIVDTVKRDEALTSIDNGRIHNINNKAGGVILALYPEYKQRNMLARYNELLEIKVDGGTLTASQITELSSLKSVWVWVQSVRTMSDNAIINGTLVDDIVWPEYIV